MGLRVVGAGLPRTATSSLRLALVQLLAGRCYHMSVIPGHPFDLGVGWNRALTGEPPDWDEVFDGYVAAVDWPASLFWRELSAAYPDALALLSVRTSAEEWWHSADETILPYARRSLAPGWSEGRGFLDLLERRPRQRDSRLFSGTLLTKTVRVPMTLRNVTTVKTLAAKYGEGAA